jgi:hypothetical protein
MESPAARAAGFFVACDNAAARASSRRRKKRIARSTDRRIQCAAGVRMTHPVAPRLRRT